MKIAIVKYNAGNIQSVTNALNRLGVEPTLTDDVKTLQAADKVIFPGVGEASSAMSYLRERNLHEVIKSLTQPILGICLGMQLMCEFSEENSTECLALFPFKVKKFEDKYFKVPQIGWNNIFNLKSVLFEGVAENSYAYFVHSFYVESGNESVATANYTLNFSAAIQRDNFYAVQFHPEKSGAIGERILENFLRLK